MAEPGMGRLDAMRRLVHPTIAVLVPFAFLCAIDGLVRAALLGSLAPRPAPAFRLVVALAGIAEAVSAGILRRERLAGFGARLRELVLVLAGSALLGWLASGRPFRGELSPLAFAVLWPVSLAGVQWLLTLHAHLMLRKRELFLTLVEGRAGSALKLAARQSSSEAGEAAEGLARLRAMIVVFEIVVLALLALAGLVRGGAGGWWVSVAIVHEALGMFAISLLAHFGREQVLLAAGIHARESGLGNQAAASAAAMAILFVAAVAAAGDRPVLPLSALAAILDWLGRVLTVRRRAMPAPLPPATRPRPADDGMLGMLQTLTAREAPAWVAAAFRVLGSALAAAAAAAAVYFLIRPLLSRDTRAVLRGLRPAAALRRMFGWIAGLAAGIPGAFAAWLRAGGRQAIRVLQAAAGGSAGATLAAAGRAGSRRRGGSVRVSRSTRDFARIVHWGARRGVPFDKSEGPGEYALRLARAAPDRAVDLAIAATAFERIVYGGGPSTPLERELAALVRSIVRRTR